MKLSSKVNFAREYAIQKHADQKYGDEPYVFHLDAVHAIVAKMGLGEEYEIASYLHDLIEDTDTKQEELATLFSQNIADMVFAVSGFGVNRKERHIDMKNKLEKYPLAINLKMCDRLANLISSKTNRPSLFVTYKKEHEEFIPLFSQGLPELLKEMEYVLDIRATKTFKY